ncbi:MAG: MaoC domain protein [Gammaproteobacteria bacterium]|nr:MaoC domain protein [Gammaproteobacteria bacterium]
MAAEAPRPDTVVCMAGPICLHFTSAPAVAPAYLKILLARKPAYATDTVPRIEAVLDRFAVDRRHLARYRKVCGDRDSAELPITYPHVLATPLHLAMIACEAFPVSLLGVVHTRNRIVQHRPLHVDDAGQIHAWLEGHRQTARGQELDLHTQVRVDGQTLWSETSTFLARLPDRSKGARTREAVLPSLEIPPRHDVTTSTFIVDPGVGRQYARVSGDFNPIHIANAAARFFGFKRAIAHGMWSLARCAAEIGGSAFSSPCTVDVAFKRPIAFCARIVLESWMADRRVGFSLRDSQADRGHLLGSVVRTN